MDTFMSSVKAEADYIASRQITSSDQKLDGAIRFGTDSINPYFANIAATALCLTRDSALGPAVTRYVQWYFRNLNWPDACDLHGTVYDYYRVNGVWEPRLTADGKEHYYDSADAYAATFLTLLRAYAATGGDVQVLQPWRHQIEIIAGLLTQGLMDPADDLTIAKPTNKHKYLMDNCEVYRGLADAAWLFGAVFGDQEKAAYYGRWADANRRGILEHLSTPDGFLPYKGATGVKWDVWYADAVCQFYPALHGVVAADDPRVEHAYQKLCEHFPGWHTFSAQPARFPWAVLGYVALLLGKTGDWEHYRQSVQSVYVANGHPWKWYVQEAAWFLMANLRSHHAQAGWGAYP